jgi:hypothetical protein
MQAKFALCHNIIIFLCIGFSAPLKFAFLTGSPARRVSRLCGGGC